MSQTAIRGKQLRLSAKEDEMNQRSETLSQPELEARKRREARERKPVREWTEEERREAFRKAREAEHHKAEARFLDEWDLCDECQENRASGICFGAASASTAVVNMQIDADALLCAEIQSTI